MNANTNTNSNTPTPANIRVYNTLTKTKEPFKPVTPGKVGIYLCGPTVYKEAHIGHMVGPIFFDTVKRYFTYNGYDVTWVVNITDVDDKLIAESNRRGLPMRAIAEEMTADYVANLKAFGVDTIDEMPRATDNMDEIIQFVQRLIDRGFAYESEGDVYFEIRKDPDYGKLSNRSADDQQGTVCSLSRKRSAGDFALWKSAKPDEPSWDSPWGKGRPGWHIECSAMSHRILGETFDIHGGGLDLLFPHHENELAQSECCHDRPMVKYWMHNGLLQASASASAGKLGGRTDREVQAEAKTEAKTGGNDAADAVEGKLSRSKGAGGLAKLITRHGGERMRFFLLRTHYRSTISFSDEGIEEAGIALETFFRFFERYERITGESFYGLPAATSRKEGDFDPKAIPVLVSVHACREAFLSKMDDDFNTGGAVSELFELVRELNRFVDQQLLEQKANRTDELLATLRQGTQTLRELAQLLGLFTTPPTQATGADDALVGKLLDLLIEIRTNARKNKDFATSDKIRDALAALEITLEDRQDGTGWRRGS